MLRFAIPEYRLPREVLDAEIEEIKNVGVEIKVGSPIESLDDLMGQGYQSVFVAVGAHGDVKMGLAGEDTPQVIESISFLQDVNLGKEVSIGNKVAVVGGSNSAVESARTARRLGAAEVSIVFAGAQSEMSAGIDETREAIEEGITIIPQSVPSGLAVSGDNVKLECKSITAGQEGTSTLEVNTVIVAIDQVPEVPEQFGLNSDSGGRLRVDQDNLATDRKGVFAGGDVVTGPSSVIEAIAAGRKAASAIDKYLGGDGEIDETLVTVEEPSQYLGRDEGFADWPRVQMPCLPPEQRIGGFSQVELGYNEEAAIGEAKRCLKCNLRFQLDSMLPMSAVIEN